MNFWMQWSQSHRVVLTVNGRNFQQYKTQKQQKLTFIMLSSTTRATTFCMMSHNFQFVFLVTVVSGRPKPEFWPLLGRRFWVNTIAHWVLQQFTQWPWIEHPTFQLRRGLITNELVPSPITQLMMRQWFLHSE